MIHREVIEGRGWAGAERDGAGQGGTSRQRQEVEREREYHNTIILGVTRNGGCTAHTHTHTQTMSIMPHTYLTERQLPVDPTKSAYWV